MNDADKKKLITEIVGDPKNFETNLADEGRRWFVERLIRSLETGPPPTADAAIPAKVRSVVAAAKTIVAAKSAIKLKIPVETSNKGWYITTAARRVETIYGAIAVDPSLADTANDKQLDLVIRRRYRTIARMELGVNSSSRPALFQYPDDTCKDYRINTSAVASWNAAAPHRSGRLTLPRWTLKIAGAAPVAPAIEKLWTNPAAACEGNVLECATAMSTVLFDSLLEARDPEALLRALNGRGPLYLAICNPTLADAVPNFIKDTDSRRVFNAVHQTIADLQIGDYVYVWNHSLYPLFQPRGLWTGEHAVVVACNTRDPLTGFRVSGHGVPPTTIAALHADLLKMLQTFQHALYATSVEFLKFMKAAAPAADVELQQRQLVVDGQNRNVQFYRFDRPYTYTNYTADPPVARTDPAFLIVYVPFKKAFGVHRSSVMAEALADPDSVIPFVQLRAVPPADDFDPVNWAIAYRDLLTGNPLTWPLFRRDNGTLSVNLLRERDMPDPPIAHDQGQAGVLTVQPMHRPTPAGAI